MSATPEISVILPVHNQAEHIQSVVVAYEEVLGRIPNGHETILVVNGCGDESLAVCRTLELTYSAVRTVYTPRRGWGKAVTLGIRVAGGDVLCFTNSARTSPEDLVLLILYAIANPGHVIKANRKKRGSLIRKLGSVIYNLECRLLCDLPYWDLNGTPKVFPRSCEKLFWMEQDGNLLDLEFNLICRSEGYPVLEVPIFSSRRFGGKSTTTWLSAVTMYWGAYQMRRRYARVHQESKSAHQDRV